MPNNEYIFPDFTKPTDFGLEFFIFSYIESLIENEAPLTDVVSLLLFMLDNDEKAELLKDLKTRKYLSEKTKKNIIEELEDPDHYYSISSILEDIMHKCKFDIKIKKEHEYIHSRITELKKSMRNAEKRSSKLKSDFKSFFNISDEETGVVLLSIMADYYNPLKKLMSKYHAHERTDLITRILGIKKAKLKEIAGNSLLLEENYLRNCNQITSRDNSSGSLTSVKEYLKHAVEEEDLNYIKRTLFTKKSGMIYELNSFPVKKTDSEIVRRILSTGRGCNILIYGPPGTGKTEYVRSICKSIDVEPEFLYSGDAGSNEERREALIRMSSIFKNSSNPLVIDDADAMIGGPRFLFSNSEPFEKSWMNNFMENTTFPLIWVVNNVSGIDEAAARRFVFTLKFDQTSMKQRYKMLKQKLSDSKHKSITEKYLRHIVSTYPVPISKLSDAVNVGLTISVDSKKDDDVMPVVENILQNYSTLITGKDFSAKPKDKPYDSSVLNTDINPEVVEKALSQYLKTSPKGTKNGNLSYLFHGAPGTGKTALAMHLAQMNEVKLMSRDASEFLSPYVGETEQNISRIFKEAEDERALLLIDEAESFLSSRNNADRNYEKLFTNQFLTSLEKYNGIVVCSTNMLDSLDHAVLRRFNFKVRFGYLNATGLKRMFELYFPSAAKNSIIDSFLSRGHKLTPGDFAVVSQNMKYRTDTPSADEIINLLEIEESYKHEKAMIGFNG